MTTVAIGRDIYGDDKWVSVRFPYDEEIVRTIKELPVSHREWCPPHKRWRVKIGSVTRLVACLRLNGHRVQSPNQAINVAQRGVQAPLRRCSE